MTGYRHLRLATILLVGALQSGPSFAQLRSAPTIDAVQPERALDRLQRDAKRGAVPALPNLAAAPAKPNTKPLFKLRSVKLHGTNAISEHELAETYAPFIGRKVSAADLTAITSAITENYRKAGWHLSRAIIHPQNADGGHLVISVVGGRIAEVRIRGYDANADAVSSILKPLIGETQSRRESVERALLLASDLPGVRIAETSLEEIGTATGRFRLVVDVVAWRNYTSVAFDNRGTSAVGPYQSYFATNFNAAFAPGDTLGVALSTTPADTDQLRFGRLSYSTPLGTDGARLSLLVLHSEVRPGDFRSLFNTQNRADFVEVRGTIAALRSQTSSLWLSGAASIGDYGERDIFGKVYTDRLRTVSGSADYQRKDELGGWNYLTVNVKQGLPIFNASAAGDGFLSRGDSSGEFTKIEAYYSRIQTLPGPWSLKLAAVGQWASRLLLASQQFYLGAAFARGFYGLDFSGDNAAAGSAELRFDQSLSWQTLKGYQLYAYLDHTRVWNVRSDTGMLKLTLAGAGARFFLPSDLQVTVEIAAPVEYFTPSVQPHRARGFVGISKAFKFCATPQWTCG